LRDPVPSSFDIGQVISEGGLTYQQYISKCAEKDIGIADAKKEVQKTRSEKVALTNEIEKLKKDLEKFRPSGPAKKGSKAA
jgi:hypothetical protein